MKLAYLILAHNAPHHLNKLIESLQHPDDAFFVHIDAKVNQSLFLNSIQSDQVYFVQKREAISWGSFEMVQATLNGIREINSLSNGFDHIILLSGADFPIKPLLTIRSFYKENMGFSFINYRHFPVKELNFGGMDRINYYSFNFRGKRETALPPSWVFNYSLKGKILNTYLNLKTWNKPKRNFPYQWTPYYGSQWWSLSNDTTQFILNFVKNHPEYIEYHKYSLIPDEMFFQSILLNAYPKKELIVNDNMRYIIFPKDSSHPNTIVEADLVEILSSKKLFARKFGPKSNILSLIDNKIK